MTGTYNLFLVALSFAVAVAASYLSLVLSRYVVRSKGLASNLWLFAAAAVMGIGIWAAHYVGMLALKIDRPISFDWMLTISSLVVGIGATCFSIYVATRRYVSNLKIVPSSLILGAGIVGMHYIGMASLKREVVLVHDPALVVASFAIAVIASAVAIWVNVQIAKSMKPPSHGRRWLSAVAMGVAICGMHYTGIMALSEPGTLVEAAPASAEKAAWIMVGVGFSALTILGLILLTIIYDSRIAAQRKISDAACKNAFRLNKILDDSSNEIFIVDSQSFNILSANKGAIENLGYEQSVLESMTLCEINSEIDSVKFAEKVQVLRDGIRNMLVFNSTHRRADGTVYPVHVSLQLQATSEGEKAELVAIITNVTERVNFEAQIAQSTRLESIGQLAAGIAHEINTPAQYVGDNTRFLKDGFEDLKELNDAFMQLYSAAQTGNIQNKDVERVKIAIESADPEYLYEEIPTAIEQSLDGITRISKIVLAMKEFSHPGGKDKELIDLNKNIANTIVVASNEWKYVAEIEVDYQQELPLVPCHPQEISQVVLNLIVNASHSIADKHEDGSGELGKITVTTVKRNSVVEICIADSGMGIPEDIRSRIFDPFFTTKGVGKGTGQGLSMAYATIVEKHNGKIAVESEVGVGTTFTITLPMAPPEKAIEEVAA